VGEKQLTLGVGVQSRRLLRESGYRVVMSRVRDRTVARFGAADLHQGLLSPDTQACEVEARNLCANAAHADVLVGPQMSSFIDPCASGRRRSIAGASRLSSAAGVWLI
jgi:N-acetylmuramoyl-L-alanine amidase